MSIETHPGGRYFETRAWKLGIAANTVPAFAFVALGGLGSRWGPPDRFWQGFLPSFIAAWIFYTGCLFHSKLVIRRRFASINEWLGRHGPPSDAVTNLVLTAPGGAARWALVYWSLFLIWNVAIYQTVTRGITGDRSIVGLVAIAQALGWHAFGGSVAALLSYLFVERGLRPLTSLVMRGSTTEQTQRIRILSRLLMAYAVSTALPLLAISLAFVGLERDRLELVPFAIWVLSAVVIAAGSAVAVASARAVSEPINEVRFALARVTEGDLSVELDVNEPGELGQLQAGVNRMVEGLRERERMRDLFGRHVGTEVAQQALLSEISLGGEVRQVTVMFVDLIGSTPLTRSQPATEVVRVLNEFFKSVVGAVTNEGGIVNQFQGDGAVCVFGAPSERTDHAASALRAARALAASIGSIDAAIGVSTGAVVAGNVGTTDRFEYTVIGDAVNEASRLCDEAKKRRSRVLASKETLDEAGDEGAHWRPAATLTLRGRGTSTETFEPSASAYVEGA